MEKTIFVLSLPSLFYPVNVILSLNVFTFSFLLIFLLRQKEVRPGVLQSLATSPSLSPCLVWKTWRTFTPRCVADLPYIYITSKYCHLPNALSLDIEHFILKYCRLFICENPFSHQSQQLSIANWLGASASSATTELHILIYTRLTASVFIYLHLYACE